MTTTLPRYVIPVTDLLPGRRVRTTAGDGTIVDMRLVRRPLGPKWEYEITHDHGGWSGGVQRHQLTPFTPSVELLPTTDQVVNFVSQWLHEHPDQERSWTYNAKALLNSVNRRLRATQIEWCPATWYEPDGPVECAFMADPGTRGGLCGWHAVRGQFPMRAPARRKARPYIAEVSGRTHEQYVAHLVDIAINEAMTDPRNIVDSASVVHAQTLRVSVNLTLSEHCGIDLTGDDADRAYEDGIGRAVRDGRIVTSSVQMNRIGGPRDEYAYAPGENL